MKKTASICTIVATWLFTLFATTSASAAPVSSLQAQTLAKQFLAAALNYTHAPALTLARTLTDDRGDATVYIFNMGEEGFLLVSGDDLLRPVLGYATGKHYDSRHSNDAFEWLLQSYHCATQNMRAAQRQGVQVQASLRAIAEREALDGSGSNAIFQDDAAKDVSPLLSTSWGQGYYYNDKCPAFSEGENGHSLVGCVALAMAQVIRYHEYPTKGFGSYAYYHSYLGRQYANFDSATYDYSHMPDRLGWSSEQADIDAISLLCYHCGVSVKMNYQNANNINGSGAFTQDVVNGLRHFGYMDAVYVTRGSGAVGQHTFDSLMRDNLDRGLPVICSGRSAEYGHAFVCDGYRSNTGYYHFNFGWDGYQNAYFTLDNMNGFTDNQGAVFNIVPSHIEGGSDTLYVDARGNGGGTSWNSATPYLQRAIDIAGQFGKEAILVKEGTYYGNATEANAFTMRSGVRVYGGFDGTEQSISDADPTLHPTILSGQGQQRVVYCDNFGSNAYLQGFLLQDGYAEEGAGALIQNKLVMRSCIFQRNTATGRKGAAFYSTGGAVIQNCIARNNTGTNAVYIEEADVLKNCLVQNNDGNGINMAGWGQVLNCTVVNNRDTGIVTTDTIGVRNSIVWNNGTDIANNCTLTFSAVGHHVADNPTLSDVIASGSCVLLADALSPSGNQGDGSYPGPYFIAPVYVRGTTELLGDYHLQSASPCVNSGDTNYRGLLSTDLDGAPRKRGGRVDMGCYESQNVGIAENTAPALLPFPNPAHDVLTIELPQASTVTIVDALGQTIHSFFAPAGTTTLSVSDLPRGVYLLHTPHAVSKLIVQ